MTPLKISLQNCDELIPDARRRILSSEARKFAELGFQSRKVWPKHRNYWHGIVKEHEKLFWLDVYKRRIARIKRMAMK